MFTWQRAVALSFGVHVSVAVGVTVMDPPRPRGPVVIEVEVNKPELPPPLPPPVELNDEKGPEPAPEALPAPVPTPPPAGEAEEPKPKAPDEIAKVPDPPKEAVPPAPTQEAPAPPTPVPDPPPASVPPSPAKGTAEGAADQPARASSAAMASADPDVDSAMRVDRSENRRGKGGFGSPDEGGNDTRAGFGPLGSPFGIPGGTGGFGLGVAGIPVGVGGQPAVPAGATPTAPGGGGGAGDSSGGKSDRPPPLELPDGGYTPDAGPEKLCNGVPTNVLTDAKNCGECGKQCKTGMGLRDQKCVGGQCTGGTNRQFWIDDIQLPRVEGQPPAIDLDGDGAIDNKFAKFLGVVNQFLAGQGPNALQENVRGLVLQGQLVLLLDMPEEKDAGQPVTVFQGAPTNTPSAGGQFKVDRGLPVTVFQGGVRTRDFYDYTTPRGVSPPILPLIIRSGGSFGVTGDAMVIPLRAHHLHFDFDANGQVLLGQMQGTVWWQDMEGYFAMQAQRYMYWEFQNNPLYVKERKAFVLIMDHGDGNGGVCQGPSFMRPLQPLGRPDDGYVAPCEILAALKITRQNYADVLAWRGPTFWPRPAGQSRDAKGNVETPDSISFALTWSATQATFE